MKKWVKITLIVFVLVLISGGYFGYNVYKMVMGSEPLVGKQEAIPEPMSSRPPITKDSADWTNWRGVNFEGKSTFKGIKTDWSKGLQKVWQVDYLCQDKSTASWSAPVVKGNRVVVPGRDEKSDIIFCLESSTGRLIWKGSYEVATETSHGPGPRATPFIDDDRVYSFGRSGDLVCWQLEDGKMLWHKSVKELGGKEPSWGFSTTPLVFENKVIVQGGGKALIVAYDKMNGDVLWKSMEGEAGYSFAITMKIENETKLLVYHGIALSCIEPADGRELWRVPWTTEYFVNATTPIIYDDIIFITSGYKMGSQAIKVKKDGYSVLWKNENFAAQHTDPVLIDGYIYGYSGQSTNNKGQFICLELATGKEMWSTSEIGQGTCTFVDGHLICFDLKGNLYLVKRDPKSFQKVGEIKTAMDDVTNLSWTVPVVANGKLYLRYLQHLYCYNLQ